MKTRTINVYKFNELSDTAKETALHNYYSSGCEYFWDDAAINTLIAYAEHFGCRITNYAIDFLNHAHTSISIEYNFDISDSEIKVLLDELGEYDNETLRGLGECKLTGYCMDEDIIDGFRIAWYNGERDIRELICSGIETWKVATENDANYQFSLKGYSEYCDSNGIEFDEFGNILK